MTNFEYWKDRILEINKKDNVAIVKDKPSECSFLTCGECDLFVNGGACRQKLISWLYSEHVKTPKLTKRERKLCEALGTGWIAADKTGRVYWYSYVPMKGKRGYEKRDRFMCISSAGFHFAFMDFEDKEPWMVENLLQLEVEE